MLPNGRSNSPGSYERMEETALPDDRGVVSAVAAAKFCSMGVVSSQKWFSCFVTISEGVFNLYDNQETFQESPSNVVLQIPLTRRHQTSAIKRRLYSAENSGVNKSADFYCFYIELDNGVFFPTRQIKIGCVARETAEKLTRAVEQCSRGT